MGILESICTQVTPVEFQFKPCSPGFNHFVLSVQFPQIVQYYQNQVESTRNRICRKHYLNATSVTFPIGTHLKKQHTSLIYRNTKLNIAYCTLYYMENNCWQLYHYSLCSFLKRSFSVKAWNYGKSWYRLCKWAKIIKLIIYPHNTQPLEIWYNSDEYWQKCGHSKCCHFTHIGTTYRVCTAVSWLKKLNLAGRDHYQKKNIGLFIELPANAAGALCSRWV